MSAYSHDRRDFLKFALAASSVSLAPSLGWAFGSEEERTTWYRNAKFGMFIHWGPYSLASVEASWPIMRPTSGGITEAEYRALPMRFNPTKFDPDAFVDLARAAGQQYMVFTTKHHDGFCMFDSSYTDYKITNTPYGKDVVRQLAHACRERDMPLGFYYSPPDMHHPAFRDTTKLAKENWNGEPARPPVADVSRVYAADRKSTRLNSSHSQISYAVFCLKKKKTHCTCPCFSIAMFNSPTHPSACSLRTTASPARIPSPLTMLKRLVTSAWTTPCDTYRS